MKTCTEKSITMKNCAERNQLNWKPAERNKLQWNPGQRERNYNETLDREKEIIMRKKLQRNPA